MKRGTTSSEEDQTTRVPSIEDMVVVDTDAYVSEGIDDVLPHIRDEYEGIRDIIANARDPLTSVYHRSVPAPNPAKKFDGIWHGQGTREKKLAQMDGSGSITPCWGPG